MGEVINLDEKRQQKIKSPEVEITGKPAVDAAIRLVKKHQPNIFVGVEKVVVETAPDGNKLGYVTNKDDQSKMVHIVLPTNVEEAKKKLGKTNVSQPILDEAASIVIANTIAHEVGHVLDDLKSGEAPAEAKEREFAPHFEQEWKAFLDKKNVQDDLQKAASLDYILGIYNSCKLFRDFVG